MHVEHLDLNSDSERKIETNYSCKYFTVLCSNPIAPLNGDVELVLNVANYSCDSGFELIGSAIRTCVGLVGMPTDGEFIPADPPICRRK